FSSRRRHTRFSRDWSSDVCSSDLRRKELLFQRTEPKTRLFEGEVVRLLDNQAAASRDLQTRGWSSCQFFLGAKLRIAQIARPLRSEERRVGKEARGGWQWGVGGCV